MKDAYRIILARGIHPSRSLESMAARLHVSLVSKDIVDLLENAQRIEDCYPEVKRLEIDHADRVSVPS